MERSVVLITGVSSGMGKATVEELGKKGYKVYGTTRDLRKYRRQNKALPNTEILQVDITGDASVKKAVEYIIKKESRIDVLVNNAGYGTAGAIETAGMKEAKDQFEINFFSVLRMMNAVLPHMRQNKSGLIINISSIVGQMGIPFQALYCASKYAIEGLTESLRMEVKRFGIHVAMIEPGDVKSGFTDGRIRINNKKEPGIYDAMLDKSMAIVEKDERNGIEPEKVAKLIEKIIRAKSPRLRYTVGPGGEIVSMYLKRFIPGGLWEYMLMDHLKL